LAEIASAVDAHERPELVWPVLLTRLAMSSRALRDVGYVVDRKFDPASGRWVPVDLPPMARGRYTVTGKAEWADGEVRRPVKLIEPGKPGPWRASDELPPTVLTVVPNGSSVHNLSEVDRLAQWLAEAAVERESDGSPLPVAHIAGQGPVAIATRNRLIAETTARLALLSAPGVPLIDANELVPEPSSVDDSETVAVTVILPEEPVLSAVHPPSGITPTPAHPAPSDLPPAGQHAGPDGSHSVDTAAADSAAVDTAGIAEALAGHRTRPDAVEALIGEITKALAVNRANPEVYQQALTALDLYGVVDTLLGRDVDPRLSAGALFDVVDRAVTDSADPIEYAGKIADRLDVLEGQGLIDSILRGPGDLGDRRQVLYGQLDGREVLAGNGPSPAEDPVVRLYAKAMTLLDKTGVAGSLPGDVFAEAARGIAQGWDGDEIGRTGTFEQRAEVTVGLLRRFHRRLTVVNIGWLARWRVAEAVRRYVAMEKAAMAELDADKAELDTMSKAEGVTKSDG
jgi:hypothetical protein